MKGTTRFENLDARIVDEEAGFSPEKGSIETLLLEARQRRAVKVFLHGTEKQWLTSGDSERRKRPRTR